MNDDTCKCNRCPCCGGRIVTSPHIQWYRPIWIVPQPYYPTAPIYPMGPYVTYTYTSTAVGNAG